MKTRIGTSFGLALLLALGVLAAMLALGLFSSPKAEADVDTTAITANPTRAGAASQISISFRHQTTQTAGTGLITVVFDSLYGFPAAAGTLPRTAITLTTGQTTGGSSNPAVDPTYTTNAAGDKTVVITIADTVPGEDRQDMVANVSASGEIAVTAASVHTLVFGTAAGITLPTAGGTAATNFITLTVGTEVVTALNAGLGFDGLAAPAGLATARTVELSSITGPAGTVVTVTGYGFTTGLSPRVYIDGLVGAAGNGIFDAGDIDLQVESTPAIAGGTFTRSFTVDTVRFAAPGAYNIGADDGVGNVSAAAPDDTPTWTLRGVVTTDKTSVRRGETVQVKLRQFGAGLVQIVSFGGVQATIPAAQNTVPASGTLNIDITVPTTTPLGTQRVSVTADGEAAARTANIDVVGAPLILSPSTAVPEQDITVSGSGFTGSSVINTLGQIRIGAADVPLANIASGAAVTADNSGNIVATVRIPVNATTRTAGSYTMTVTDAAGRTGQATLTIPSRTVASSPASGRRLSNVTISGTGFPSRSTVTITYTDSAAVVTTLGSATPDSTGAFTGTFAVPNTAPIPSSNTITATSAADGNPVATGSHSVPGAVVTVAPASASSGSNITVTGTGFPGFASMTVLTIGGVAAIPTPAPASGADGAFTTTALVPQLNVGTQAVSVTVGGIVGTSSLSVVAAPPAPVVPVVAAPTATATVFASVVAQADNLVRVWRYDNATQSWAFYDPRPAFAAANTLTTTATGNIVWVNVKVNQTFQGQTLFAGWNLISLQ